MSDGSSKSINARQGLIFVLLLLALVATGVGVAVQRAPLQTYERSSSRQVVATTIANAYFACADQKTINAHFSEGGVTLELSDGRTFTLEQSPSASGARYSNEGDQVVFWNKGNTAFVEEEGSVVYSDCVTSQ